MGAEDECLCPSMMMGHRTPHPPELTKIQGRLMANCNLRALGGKDRIIGDNSIFTKKTSKWEGGMGEHSFNIFVSLFIFF